MLYRANILHNITTITSSFLRLPQQNYFCACALRIYLPRFMHLKKRELGYITEEFSIDINIYTAAGWCAAPVRFPITHRKKKKKPAPPLVVAVVLPFFLSIFYAANGLRRSTPRLSK